MTLFHFKLLQYRGTPRHLNDSFMSSDTKSSHSRATADEASKRVARASELLADFTLSTAAQRLASEENISTRQARRYVNTAASERVGDSLSRPKLLEGMAVTIERLELIADQAFTAGDTKEGLKALKAAGDIRTKIYAAHQREDIALARTSSAVTPF